MSIKVLAVKAAKEFEFSRFFKFCLVGASGVVVNMFFFWFFYRQLGIYSLVASLFAVQLAIVNNFVWNDKWTWKEKRKPGIGQFSKRLAKFAFASNLVSATGNLLGVFVFLNVLKWHYLFSNFLAIGLGVVLNFLINHYWTYSTAGKTT